MIAYIFWHTPRQETPLARYEAFLIGFHQALAASPPESFLGSTCHRLETIPWLGDGTGYEDRYFLTGSEGLDRLDTAAVDAIRRGLHDAAAELSSTGAGGLYRQVRPGFLDRGCESEALWMEKPPGVAYADALADLETRVPEVVQIWRRQMVLGPAPEFCLLGPPGTFPRRHSAGSEGAVRLRRCPVWPTPRDVTQAT